MRWISNKKLCYAPVFHCSLFCSLDNSWYLVLTKHRTRGSVEFCDDFSKSYYPNPKITKTGEKDFTNIK